MTLICMPACRPTPPFFGSNGPRDPMTPLEALGADQQWRELAQSHAGRLGRVVQVDRGECEVMTAFT